jgi:hypothetical protein
MLKKLLAVLGLSVLALACQKSPTLPSDINILNENQNNNNNGTGGGSSAPCLLTSVQVSVPGSMHLNSTKPISITASGTDSSNQTCSVNLSTHTVSWVTDPNLNIDNAAIANPNLTALALGTGNVTGKVDTLSQTVSVNVVP